MRFRNSLRLLMENFKHVYKLLWAKLIIGLVTSALCCAFVLPELLRIWNSHSVQRLISDFKAFFSALLSVSATEMEAVKQSLFAANGSIDQVLSLLSSMTVEIVWTLVGCMAVYLLKRFAETICHFTTGSMLNDKMSTYAETKYSTALVANLGKAAAYSVVYVPLVFLFDLAIIGVVYLILKIFPIFMAFFFGTTAVAILQALKLTVAGPLMPAMTTDNKTISQAFGKKTKPEQKQRIKAFSTYLVCVYLIMIVNVIAAVCTFGSGLLISVPASFFFLICMQYVNYYTARGKRYFLTYEYIAKNPDKGDSEHYFDYIEAETAQAAEINLDTNKGE